MRRRNAPRRSPRRRVRFPNPLGQEPVRWTIRKVIGGKYVIVDAEGVSVLDHWDPAVRLYNRHLAKGAPVQMFALVHCQRFIERLESPLADWLLTLISDAFWESLPHAAGVKQPVLDRKKRKTA